MTILDPDEARRQLDEVGETYTRLLQEWAQYEQDLQKAVEDADPILPLWEIAERSGRHRNHVSRWTTTRRRPRSSAGSR
jgi:hypothetical protein